MSTQPQAPMEGLKYVEALEAIRNGDPGTARTIFGVSQAQVSDDGLRRALISFDRGRILFSRGQYEEAQEYLNEASALIAASDSETAKHMALYTKVNDGAVRLHNGDAHGAVALFTEATSFIEDHQLESPVVARAALSMKAASYRALTRANLNAGDIEESLYASEQASRLQFELLTS